MNLATWMGWVFASCPTPWCYCFSKCGEVKVVKATSKTGHVGLKLLNFLLWSSPSPKSNKNHPPTKRIVVHFFIFRDLSNLPRMLPWRSGVGWDYRSSKNTIFLVVTRQHPAGGGVHIPYTLQGNEKTYPTGKGKSSTQEWLWDGVC